MILTGREIHAEVERGRVHISPFEPARIESNSYGFRLGKTILTYRDEELDSRRAPTAVKEELPENGMALHPGRLYLGETMEVMGSSVYAATLYANRSTASMGMWIQFSAPLGHTGAIIPWTLEIRVAQKLIVRPGMSVGKIAFWSTVGVRDAYSGRYADSVGVRSSGLSIDFCESPRGAS